MSLRTQRTQLSGNHFHEDDLLFGVVCGLNIQYGILDCPWNIFTRYGAVFRYNSNVVRTQCKM